MLRSYARIRRAVELPLHNLLTSARVVFQFVRRNGRMRRRCSPRWPEVAPLHRIVQFCNVRHRLCQPLDAPLGHFDSVPKHTWLPTEVTFDPVQLPAGPDCQPLPSANKQTSLIGRNSIKPIRTSWPRMGRCAFRQISIAWLTCLDERSSATVQWGCQFFGR
jgi:hypothetical protein